MSFGETIFLFLLALVVFGPKKLPEIARQAGKLLAELRRASNEFKSQIETEIAHLEVEKKQQLLPPATPPSGTVASLSLNPASESNSAEAGATLAAPVADPVVPTVTPANGSAAESPVKETAATLDSSVGLETASASQDRHA